MFNFNCASRFNPGTDVDPNPNKGRAYKISTSLGTCPLERGKGVDPPPRPLKSRLSEKKFQHFQHDLINVLFVKTIFRSVHLWVTPILSEGSIINLESDFKNFTCMNIYFFLNEKGLK